MCVGVCVYVCMCVCVFNFFVWDIYLYNKLILEVFIIIVYLFGFFKRIIFCSYLWNVFMLRGLWKDRI